MVVLNNPYIVVSQDPLDSVDDMALLLERAAPLTQPLAVIAPAIAAPVLSMLLSNRTSGLVHCCAIGVPQAAQSEWLQDIATLTGATLVQRLAGQTLGDLRIDQWGMAERLESGRGSTQAVGMLPPEEDTVKSHIQIMRATLEATRDPAQRERIGARIARLSRQACILALADPDDQRGDMRLHLAERTLKVLRAAMSEGVVPGAGVGLVRARAALSNLHMRLQTNQPAPRLCVSLSLSRCYELPAMLARRLTSLWMRWIRARDPSASTRSAATLAI